MDDEQEQSDEMMALQSIFEDETFVCNVSKRPFTGQISIFLDTITEDHDQDHEFMCNGTVVPLSHLSPLVLSFSLPSNYPSTCPPDVTLSCLWLSAQQLEMLSDKLLEKWTENVGSVVLFTWIDFLKTEAVELLGIKFPIDVSEEKIMKLTEQSILREEDIFRRGLHFCPVCLAEKSGSQCICLSTCGHVFCKDCLSGFLSVYIQEGTVNAINCPCEGCDEQLYPNIVGANPWLPLQNSLIKSLVTQSDFERYDRLLLQNTLDIMPDIKYCPRVQCQKPVVVDKDDGVGFCHACNFAFCTKCKLTYHGIEKCKWERDFKINKDMLKDKDPKEYFRQWDYWAIPEEERMRLATEYMDGDDEVRGGLEEYYGKERMMDMLVDLQAQKWIKSNTKQCPKCSTNIEKSYGCNKMVCIKCCARFCWSCSREIKSKNPYDHFSDPLSPCYNKLADAGQIVEDNDNAENFDVVDD